MQMLTESCISDSPNPFLPSTCELPSSPVESGSSVVSPFVMADGLFAALGRAVSIGGMRSNNAGRMCSYFRKS